ncbi:choline/ethanolaminephosphotransferase 1-like isoform X2 [Patiria miniata]|nr:choline/ethanolaminephosphotransferase 1-like isoform X2 [Patiria miniata]
MFSDEIRTEEQINHLNRHEYTRTGRTFVEPFMEPYWWWPVADLVPRTINANVISVFGVILNIISTVVLMYYAPTATEEAPRWAYSLAGVNIFLFQTCDSVDGRQCLRYKTKLNWHLQLAELFDHACDSITKVCVTIEFGICMKIGGRPELFVPFMLTAMFMFFTAHWQTYISGLVRFTTFDVLEAQQALCFGYLATAVMGPDIWAKKAFALEWRELIIIATAMSSILKFFNQAAFVWGRGHRVTVAGTSMLGPSLHIATAFLLTIVTKVMTNLYERQPCVFLIIFGLIEAKMSNQFMTAYMYKSKVKLLDSTLLGPLILCVNHLLNEPIQGYALLWIVMVYCAADWLLYFRRVSLGMCRLLQVTCFGSYKFED